MRTSPCRGGGFFNCKQPVGFVADGVDDDIGVLRGDFGGEVAVFFAVQRQPVDAFPGAVCGVGATGAARNGGDVVSGLDQLRDEAEPMWPVAPRMMVFVDSPGFR